MMEMEHFMLLHGVNTDLPYSKISLSPHQKLRPNSLCEQFKPITAKMAIQFMYVHDNTRIGGKRQRFDRSQKSYGEEIS